MAFIILLIYVVVLLIRPHEWGAAGAQGGESNIIRLSLMACMAVFLIFNRNNKNIKAPQFTLMLMFTFIVIVSLVAIGWFGGALNFGQIFITTALIPFFLVSGIIDSQKKQTVLFVVVIIASFIMVLNGHTQANSETGIGIAGNFIRQVNGNARITYLGIFDDPNDLGMFLVMTIPPLFFFMNRVKPWFKLPFIFGVGIILYGIYLTNSRGTLLAALSLVALWFWKRFGMVKSIWTGLALSPGLLLILSKFRSISAEDESSQGRLDAWYEGYQMFRYNPVFGVGNNQFLDYHNQTAHNSFILVLAEQGILGALLWTGLLVTTTVLLVKISSRSFIPLDLPENDKKMTLAIDESKIALTLLYSFLAYMVSAFFLSRAYTPLLYLYLGMAAACWGRTQMMFPKGDSLYEIKKLVILTVQVTFALMVGIYVLMKIGL